MTKQVSVRTSGVGTEIPADPIITAEAEKRAALASIIPTHLARRIAEEAPWTSETTSRNRDRVRAGLRQTALPQLTHSTTVPPDVTPHAERSLPRPAGASGPSSPV